MRRFLVLAACLLTSVSSITADSGTSGSPTRRVKSKSTMRVTPERSAAAMTFVQQHHPELADLLVYLRDNLPNEYNKAVRELFRTSERLARLQENGDARRYNLELQIWQTHSRAQLLSARIRMRWDARLEAELRKLLELQFQLRLAQLENDRDRAVAKVDKLNEQIEQFTLSREQVIDRHLRQLAGSKDKPTKAKPTVTDHSTEQPKGASSKKSGE